MRFTIEQRHLTDPRGKPLEAANPVTFFTLDANDAREALQLFVCDHKAEFVGEVLTFPGLQAVATMRDPTGVFTIQIGPTSDRLRIR